MRINYLSISLTGLPCHREPSIVLMSMVWIVCLSVPLRETDRVGSPGGSLHFEDQDAVLPVVVEGGGGVVHRDGNPVVVAWPCK